MPVSSPFAPRKWRHFRGAKGDCRAVNAYSFRLSRRVMEEENSFIRTNRNDLEMSDRESTADCPRHPCLCQGAEPSAVVTCLQVALMLTEELQDVIHDLQVRQIELESQVEGLRRAESELAEPGDRCVDVEEVLARTSKTGSGPSMRCPI